MNQSASTDAEPRERGFFSRLRQRLNQGRSWLGAGLASAFGSSIDAASLEEIEETLLLSDAGVDATEHLVDTVRSLAGKKEYRERTLKEILRDAIAELLAPLEQPLDSRAADGPCIILVVGVNGTGKTTTIGKLAHRLRQQGQTVMLAAGDTFRAAAVEQLTEWAGRSGSAIISQDEGADPAAVVFDALSAARARGIDVVLADTAGRLHTAGGLMDELDKIGRVIRRFDVSAPHEVLLVLDATQGQNALAQAVEFQRRIGVTGVVITKLDGSAKGGIVLAIARRLGLPIRFIAIGESIDDFESFRAREFAAALTGTSVA